jgi:hypothetical protein
MMETIRRLGYTANYKPDDHFVSFDIHNGFYALSTYPKDREAIIAMHSAYGVDPAPLFFIISRR